MDFIRRRRLSVFGHIAWLTEGTPAHNAVHCQVGLASGRSLGRDWRHHPGRPHARWTDQLCSDTGSVPANLWRQDRSSYGAMVEQHDGPSWLRDDNDEVTLKFLTKYGVKFCWCNGPLMCLNCICCWTVNT